MATEVLTSQRDLGVGTSKQGSAAGFMGLNAARPLTIASLLESSINFVRQQRKPKDNEVPYTPINQKPNPAPAAASKAEPSDSKATLPTPAAPAPSAVASSSPFASINPSVNWPRPYKVGAGLENLGNTCFLNSALQCLLHTPPLVRIAEERRHDSTNCKFLEKKGFCMSCALPALVNHSFKKNISTYSPTIITRNLRKIASHFRIGRQEDAHEFLRFCIDNMQLSALFGKDPKMPQAMKDSTFVHQIFGGRLRSRVKCLVCSHPSDTFDSVLDLSLDLNRGISSIKDALSGFTKVDQLKGQNKYKCEKCKKLVNAEKSFTIDEAPLCLTIHLKRFTPSGRKIGDTIHYPETLKLGPYMSDPSSDPTYKLYGVINHSGGGPHSGHYTAHVKSSDNKWHHMNDSFVSPCAPPISGRNAYVLFYARDRGDILKMAINGGVSSNDVGGKGVNGHGKRTRDGDDPAPAAGPSNLVQAHGSPSVASSNGALANAGSKGWSNGVGHGSPSPKKQKQHPNGHANGHRGPRPPAVQSAASIAAQAANGGYVNAYATPPLTPGGGAKGVYQSIAPGGGKSKAERRKEKGKIKITTVGKLKPRLIRE